MRELAQRAMSGAIIVICDDMRVANAPCTNAGRALTGAGICGETRRSGFAKAAYSFCDNKTDRTFRCGPCEYAA